MKSKFASFAMMLAAVLTLVSCLEEEEGYVYTDDSAITSFYVTTAKQTKHTKSSTGADSTYTVTTSLTSYRFCIDQATNTIYNPDSLPYGVNAKRLVCSFAGLNSSPIYMKSLTSDSVTYLSTSDSLDFSSPRELQVMSNSGLALRKYTVTVNVHKEDPDSFRWDAMTPNADLRKLTGVRAVALTTAEGASRLLLFGTDGDNTHIYIMSDGAWTPATHNFNHLLAADVYKNAVTQGEYVYIAENGNVMRSTDGCTWEERGSSTPVAQLVAASPIRLYAYDAQGALIASEDGGATWTVSSIDSETSLLPHSETTYVLSPLRTNADSYRVTLLGADDNGDMAIWGKIDEGEAYSENQAWTYYDVTSDNRHVMPRLTSLNAATYDGYLYVLGTPTGKDESQTAFYRSQDGGITWAEDSVLAIPGTFAEGATTATRGVFALTTDKDNFVWVVNAKNGMTWRGRINRLGWRKEQTNFTE